MDSIIPLNLDPVALSVNVNQEKRDCIIESRMFMLMDVRGENPFYTNPERTMVKYRASVIRISVYLPPTNAPMFRLNLDPNSIKILAEKIAEIEALETEQEYHFSD
jgi:hypothetical protein